jgi:tetratricopeptide (TPR) repeat protein
MRRVLECEPPLAKVWYEAACLAQEMCEFDNAQAHIQKALTLEPMNVLIHIKIAEILYSLKRYNEAISCLEGALGLCH